MALVSSWNVHRMVVESCEPNTNTKNKKIDEMINKTQRRANVGCPEVARREMNRHTLDYIFT